MLVNENQYQEQKNIRQLFRNLDKIKQRSAVYLTLVARLEIVPKVITYENDA